MKKYLGFGILAVAMLLAVSVSAQERGMMRGFDREAFKAAAQGDKETFRAELETKREAFKTEVEARKEEFRTANQERKAAFWNGAKRMIGERFSAAVANMERMQERVGALIDRLKTSGEDTSIAEGYLEDSEESLAAAKLIIEEIKVLIPASGEQITPEIFEEIKLKAREAKDLLKEAHASLINAMKEARKIMADDDDTGEDEEEDEEENEDSS